MAELPFALPIDDVLDALRRSAAESSRLVLVAPPGAGKTTRVPLVLMDEPFAKGGKIILLEPRRLAARAAAERMARSLGESVGDTVGLRVRLQSRISARTRLEVVTEGVFARMILDDPALDGVAAVIFDEFHERSLDADLGLALALEAQAGLREDLRILVMSATLDGARVARLMSGAPVIVSEGRAYPVETRYVSRDSRQRIEDEITRVILTATRAETGSILVFLPGQGEIRRVAQALEAGLSDKSIEIAPLYGAMDRAAQDRAVLPAPSGKRKIVLATSLAETSLTIEGVRVVIDSGLSRVPRFEPDLGLTRLETLRVSRAAADQRRGRAGRTEPGICYRLWEEAATGAMEPFSPPEILSADLSGVLLDLAAWGVRDPQTLAWLDPPPVAAVKEARLLLQSLGALETEGAITPEGRAIRALALPPRLARMVIEAARRGEARLGADLAAVLVERGLGGDRADLTERVENLRRGSSRREEDARRLARGFADEAARQVGRRDQNAGQIADCGRLLALAYPDRIAKARGKAGEFLMANGRAASLEPHDRLAREGFLAIAEIAGRAGAARILAAAPLSSEEIDEIAAGQIEASDDLTFDRASASLRRRRVRRLGALVLAEQISAVGAGPEAAAALAGGVADLGISRLPWTKAQKQWRDRVMFLRRAEGEDWPDVSDEALAETASDWLAPFIEGRTSLVSITAGDLDSALQAMLAWDLGRRLEAEAPTHFEVPTGSRIAVDYEAEGGPVLAVRVQELFGLATHPSLAGGRVPLTLHLLSPAHRLIQITRDLPGFWAGSWSAVKSDMKGRYPRHSWPDDPARAAPTARAKPRGT
ncbi:MAG: hrpB [Hyphomicrobiales bacterium]|nr:hrpB [Hyphomicrobiales bacterium]